MTRVNIDDAKNYKKCSMKSYEVYACIPEAGTCIINRLHNTDLYKRYKKDYMKAEQAKKYQGLPLANGNQVCIYGVAGEFSLVPLQVVLNNYVLDNGMSVSEDELKKRWVKLKAKSNFREFFACFVPKIQIEHLGRMTVNDSYVNHGKGDFIVCDSINGKPNMNTRRVVNGLIFSNTYNNQGWTNCLSVNARFTNYTINTLPSLVAERIVEINKEEIISKKIITIIGLFKEYYKFKIVSISNEIVNEYHGIMKEYYFEGKTLVYNYTVDVKGEKVGIMIASKINGTSPIVMSVLSKKDGLQGCCFPSNVKRNNNRELECFTSVTQLNCKEIVDKEIKAKTFDDYLDNRVKETNFALEQNKEEFDFSGIFEDIRKVFEENGFLILNDEKGYDTYKIVLSGDNDDTITVLVKIEPKDLDYKILIKAKSNNKTLNKAKVFTMVEDIPESVYKLLLSTFALNNTNRCDKVMQLIANYRKAKYIKNEIKKKTYEYVFGTVKVTAILDNDSIIYKCNDKEIVTNHFDNVRTIAGKVNDLIKEKENDFNEIGEF